MTTKKEYIEDMVHLATEAYKDHQIISGSAEDGRWVIGTRYEDGSLSGTFLTEIISLMGGRLFVGGDTDDCVFAYFGCKKDESDYHRAKVSWMGRQHDFRYIQEKACIGLTDSGKITESYESDVAQSELREYIDDDYFSEKDKEVAEDALEGYTDSAEELFRFLYENLDDSCELHQFGMVVSPRVIYAWAACRRLCELMD